MRVPPCANDSTKRSKIGKLLQLLVSAGITQRGDASSWWAVCQRNHRQEFTDTPVVTTPGSNYVMSPCPFPISQPRQDMLASQVASVICKQDRYMLCDANIDQELKTRKERALHKFWLAAGFETRVREILDIITDTNVAWWRLCWDEDKSKPFGGLVMDVIPPEDCVLFPCTSAGLSGARLIGHRFMRRAREIEYLQKTGTFFNDSPVLAGASLTENDLSGQIAYGRTSPESSGPEKGDLLVECFDVLFKYAEDTAENEKPKPEVWYRAIIDLRGANLLSFEPYPYSKPWYFDASLITAYSKAYWPYKSVGRLLAHLQSAANNLHSAIYNGVMASIMPPTYGEPADEKDKRYNLGEIIPVDDPQHNLWSPDIRPQVQGAISALKEVRDEANIVARISENTMGAEQARDTTATENSIIASGVATGNEEYIDNFSLPLKEMAPFTCELLATHYSEWASDWGQDINLSPQDLMMPALWEPMGKSPSNTPGAILAAIPTLMNAVMAAGQAAASGALQLTGVDAYEVINVAIANMPFTGQDNIQMSREQMQASIAQQAQQQMMMQATQQQQGQPNGNGPGNRDMAPQPNNGAAPPGNGAGQGVGPGAPIAPQGPGVT